MMMTKTKTTAGKVMAGKGAEMAENWSTILFGNCTGGVSSASDPDFVAEGMLAWGKNIDVRGGRARTRPAFVRRIALPNGIVQGMGYFGVMGGMLVLSIAGRLYKVRVNSREMSCDEIFLDFVNSSRERHCWMCQTVETLVIQSGMDAPVYYDGARATRSTMLKETPRGGCMAYGNGRLWVAQGNELKAGDIRLRSKGSELKFTEVDYLYGGGALSFGAKAIAFIPVTGVADIGALLVFETRGTSAVRADVTSRNEWQYLPGFVTSVLRSAGSVSQESVVSVNQDLYWRDAGGGIRSLRTAMADEGGPGNSPISEEVSRVTGRESVDLLAQSSGVFFDNRLLVTASPYIMSEDGNTGFKDLLALDFAPLSSMQGKTAPAWCGEWEGLNFIGLASGKFLLEDRCFAVVRSAAGGNELWEILKTDDARTARNDDPGTGAESRIVSYFETPRRDFGDATRLKRLERVDIQVSELDGLVDLQVWWRADATERWSLWDGAETGAVTRDASTAEPHAWKNLRAQTRSQLRTFTIPDGVDGLMRRAAHVGHAFQLRVSWRGRCRIERVMVRARVIDDIDFADRESWAGGEYEYDVTGNEIHYKIEGGN
jgi:hypothetical protein